MTQKIILFNGPPRCGKDTAALAALRSPEIDAYKVFDRMSMPIKRAFAATTNLSISGHDMVEYWEDRKEETIPCFGVSYRQWQIDFSERFMKPLYGERVFAELFLSRMKRQHKDAVAFVPDCGFDVEYSTLADCYEKENVLVVKIYREGCTFAGDSRNYLSVGSHFNSDIIRNNDNVKYLTNNQTQEDFELKVLKTVKEWLQ